MISKRTQIRMLVDGPTNGTGWSARRLPLEGEKDDEMSKKRIALQIDSPSDAIIGKYTVGLLKAIPRLSSLDWSTSSYSSKFVR